MHFLYIRSDLVNYNDDFSGGTSPGIVYLFRYLDVLKQFRLQWPTAFTLAMREIQVRYHANDTDIRELSDLLERNGEFKQNKELLSTHNLTSREKEEVIMNN